MSIDSCFYVKRLTSEMCLYYFFPFFLLIFYSLAFFFFSLRKINYTLLALFVLSFFYVLIHRKSSHITFITKFFNFFKLNFKSQSTFNFQSPKFCSPPLKHTFAYVYIFNFLSHICALTTAGCQLNICLFG